jgi:uncharacterized coiled-coil DUF342 family protein
MNIPQLQSEAKSLRDKAEMLRKDAQNHNNKMTSFMNGQDPNAAKRERDQVDKLNADAVIYEEQAMKKEQQMLSLDQQAAELEKQKLSHDQITNDLDTKIKDIRGDATTPPVI